MSNEHESRSKTEVMASLVLGEAYEVVAKAEATKRINEAAAVAVRSILTAELTGLRKTIIDASKQLSANRTETRRWVVSVAVIAGLIGSFGALVAAKFLHLI